MKAFPILLLLALSLPAAFGLYESSSVLVSPQKKSGVTFKECFNFKPQYYVFSANATCWECGKANTWSAGLQFTACGTTKPFNFGHHYSDFQEAFCFYASCSGQTMLEFSFFGDWLYGSNHWVNLEWEILSIPANACPYPAFSATGSSGSC